MTIPDGSDPNVRTATCPICKQVALDPDQIAQLDRGINALMWILDAMLEHVQADHPDDVDRFMRAGEVSGLLRPPPE